MWVLEETLSSLLSRSSRFKYIRDPWKATRPEGTRYVWYSPAFDFLDHSRIPNHRSSRDRLGRPTYYPVETQTFVLAGLQNII